MSASPQSTSKSAVPTVTTVVLTGNPNCGKTTLFNALTGLRAKVGNYAGVTVERKEGRLQGVKREQPIIVLDLPGTYSLSPQSLDEQISRDVLFNRLAEVPVPSLVVAVVDASNLQRNLYYATQVIELGYPTVLALNMMDIARENGHEIDAAKLSKQLGVPVFPIVASTHEGLAEFRQGVVKALEQNTGRPEPLKFVKLPEAMQQSVSGISTLLELQGGSSSVYPDIEALLVLSDDKVLAQNGDRYATVVHESVAAARKKLDTANVDWRSVPIEARYARVSEIQLAVCTETMVEQETFSDKLDRVLTHKVWGMLIFVGIMLLIFQSIFTFAEVPMTWLEEGVAWAGDVVSGWLPPGELNDLLVKGVITGVGAVVVFLPQILLLFLFIGLLEDTGYMARAAFLMDRLMSKVGLHGKSFIPMLSSFACAIPGIMATRTIESPKDRLVTIMVAPLMSCSARLPVYTVLIAAIVPSEKTVLGFFKVSALIMLSMYLLGIVFAMLMAWLFKKTLLKGEPPLLIMELPPYKRPLVGVVLRHMWDRSKLFLKRAGTVILGIAILLWFLMTYPKDAQLELQFASKREVVATATFPDVTEEKEIEALRTEQLAAIDMEEAGENLRHSYAGRLGHVIEPFVKPLGFDWKIGIGVVASFAAREVFVTTMSTVYNVGEFDDSDEGVKNLAQTLREQKWPDGRMVYTPLVCVALMVFYVFALQCVSTVAVVRRETNSWKWAVFQWVYMAVLAWGLAFITYQGGRLLGWG